MAHRASELTGWVQTAMGQPLNSHLDKQCPLVGMKRLSISGEPPWVKNSTIKEPRSNSAQGLMLPEFLDAEETLSISPVKTHILDTLLQNKQSGESKTNLSWPTQNISLTIIKRQIDCL